MAAIDNAISQAAGWSALAVCGYLSVGLFATVITDHAGKAARVARLALVLYPRVLRAAMRTTAAALVGLGATFAGASAADAGAPAPPAPPVVAPASPPAEPLDWPVHAPHASTSHAAVRGHPAPNGVTVRPGDSLWRIAEQALGRSATPARTAAVWPRWWAANRVEIGDNPNLLRPGRWLRAPRTLGRTGS